VLRWVLAFTIASSCLLADANAADLPVKHVIVVEPTLAAIVANGYERSETFRTLVHQVEASEWTVFVQSGPCPMKEAIGCLLHQVGVFEGRRYLRLRIDRRNRSRDRVLSTVAHELQHALEVITSGEVHDTASLIALYERIGNWSTRVAGGRMFETKAARRAEVEVAREYRRAKKPESIKSER
jgi:hypothetical protein